jgi:hypothetical protein
MPERPDMTHGEFLEKVRQRRYSAPPRPTCDCIDGSVWLPHPQKPGEYIGARCAKCNGRGGSIGH